MGLHTQFRINDEEDGENIDSDQPFDDFSEEESLNSVEDEDSPNSDVLDDPEEDEEEDE